MFYVDDVIMKHMHSHMCVIMWVCYNEYTFRPALETKQFWLQRERLLIMYRKIPVLIWMERLRRKELMM